MTDPEMFFWLTIGAFAFVILSAIVLAIVAEYDS